MYNRLKTSNLHHAPRIDGLRLTYCHGHAQGLQAVEGRGVRHRRRRADAIGRWRVGVDRRVEGGWHVARLRGGRGIVQGSHLILARVLLLVFSGEVEAALDTVAAIMSALVSKTQHVSGCFSLGFLAGLGCCAVC